MGGTIDRAVVPGIVRGSLYVILLVAGITSLPFIGGYGPLPTTTLLDAWILLFIAACILRGPTQTTYLLLILGGYLLTRIIPALANGSPLEDFAQAYRWVLYLIVFAFAVGRQWGPTGPLVKVTWALLLMALAKAGITFATQGPGERPGLLLENNFELALFAGLVAVLYPHMAHRFWSVTTLGALTILSGSRSGAVAFLILAVYAISQARMRNLFTRYVSLLVVPALVIVPVWIFTSRAAASTQIDRLNFLDVFWHETRNWDLLNWLFGTVPITPLSDGCIRLSYYQSLFSSTGDGTCYSVILHAFILRVIFDAGILGLILAFGVAWYTMRRSNVHTPLAVALLAIALTNSMSVSGLNNPYVALPILLAIATAQTKKEARPDAPTKERAQTGQKQIR